MFVKCRKSCNEREWCDETRAHCECGESKVGASIDPLRAPYPLTSILNPKSSHHQYRRIQHHCDRASAATDPMVALAQLCSVEIQASRSCSSAPRDAGDDAGAAEASSPRARESAVRPGRSAHRAPRPSRTRSASSRSRRSLLSGQMSSEFTETGRESVLSTACLESGPPSESGSCLSSIQAVLSVSGLDLR